MMLLVAIVTFISYRTPLSAIVPALFDYFLQRIQASDLSYSKPPEVILVPSYRIGIDKDETLPEIQFKYNPKTQRYEGTWVCEDTMVSLSARLVQMDATYDLYNDKWRRRSNFALSFTKDVMRVLDACARKGVFVDNTTP